MAISPIAPQSSHVTVSPGEMSSVGAAVSQTQNNTSVQPDMAIAVPSVEQTRQAAEMLNKSDTFKRTSLNFQVEDGSGQLIIKVMDTESNEVIRQIPSAEALALSRAIESNQGMLVKTKS